MIDNINNHVDKINLINEKISELCTVKSEVTFMKEQVEQIEAVNNKIIGMQNDTTERLNIFPTHLSEVKLELEERIEVIEEANMVIEKSSHKNNQKDLSLYEEIKFETEEETERFNSEVNAKKH